MLIEDCIYHTDPDWISVLRSNDIHNDVNFWRKDNRELHLVPGAYFYFKQRKTRVIVGRGTFKTLRLLTIQQAWQEYEKRNGVETYSDFKQRVEDVFDVDESYQGNFGCIILDNLQWLDSKDYYLLTENDFPIKGILGPKYHNRGSMPSLENIFTNYNSISNTATVVADVPSLPYPSRAIDYEEPTNETVRELIQTSRIIRDTGLSRDIKQLYRCKCQLCGTIIAFNNGERYAEGHHIRPLGHPHNGPDIDENILCVCPNCHAKLDFGVIQIEEKKLDVHVDHAINNEFIRYHNEIIYRK